MKKNKPEIVKDFFIKPEERSKFLPLLYAEYQEKRNPYVAIQWAFGKFYPEKILIKNDFPEIVLFGDVNPQLKRKFPQEKHLGNFVLLQPGLIIFFPGEELYCHNIEKKGFCGVVTMSSETKGLTNNFRIINFNFSVSCHPYQKNEDFIFHYGCGFQEEDGAENFYITKNDIEKINRLFFMKWKNKFPLKSKDNLF